MEVQDAIKGIGKPQVQRLKDLGMGLKMGKVFGRRVLVEPIKPFTEIEEAEKKGLLYFPDSVKEQNTPMPSTGIVLQLGLELIEEFTIGRVGSDVVPESEWPLRPGDAVMYSKYAGSEASIDRGVYRILQFEEIMCTLDITNPEAYAITTD